MAETFLHGVEVIELTTGPRPIRTLRSSVIGIVGTAPGAAGATAASLALGLVAANSGLTVTAVTAGADGNGIAITVVNPATASQTLAVSVTGTDITVTLGTDGTGAPDSTADEVSGAIAGDVDAAALVTVTNAAGSDGSGILAPSIRTRLAGGSDEPFPVNTPVLVAGSRREAAALGDTGTLPAALDGIFDQGGAAVVVVRVAEGADDPATTANVIGGVNTGTGNLEGVHALLAAEGALGVQPRILCATGWTHQRDGTANAVVAEMVGIAERLRAVIVADGPSTIDADAIAYRGDWGSDRVYVIDPFVKVSRDGVIVTEPASARVAGIIARTDAEQGFWHSPSNKAINGIVGTARPIDFKLGDINSRANLLNEREVTTIIRESGFRLWGNRTTSADPKFAFLSVRRTADLIADSLQRAHLWAVDRNITKTYVEDVTEGVNAYLASLQAQGAILGGTCWPDPDLNTPQNIAQGKVFFNFDFRPPTPAEHITFRSEINDDYIAEVFS
ncbi:phage tail sheath subtilisin-like domain-containing protein [Meridianimarinicoccus sp. RP-17]|uniref:phage tail sheath subtilisin-like domain-containing protein n=1 Tax=Meridianimarinicoccus zhengii TaxID=2056810 RepID=UPI000DAD1D40|nr:phage tail sheath subtilisin-like domain-containing protein [Phycocomes zhengii]